MIKKTIAIILWIVFVVVLYVPADDMLLNDGKFQVADNATATAFGNMIIGSAAAGVDYTLTFAGETFSGLITWMEDEDRFDIADDIKVEQDIDIGGTMTITSEIVIPSLSAQANDWAPVGYDTSRVWAVSTTGSNQNITGIAALPGRVITLIKSAAVGNIVLQSASASSLPANQFLFNTSKTIQANETITIWYDPNVLKWRAIGGLL